jgi:serine/threonine-protein kinase
MGAVYEAEHLRLSDRKVAIKVLLGGVTEGGEAWLRFRREAEIGARIGHPGIVQVTDWDRLPDGSPFMVMEMLRGEDLAGRMAKGPLPPPLALRILREMGAALHAAHHQGIIHRDLKPQNIFLVDVDEPEGTTVHPKILDFGISKIAAAHTVLTRESQVFGTPQYMSPEQAQGKAGEVDARADQFALATIAYEMLSGRPAFLSDSVAGVLFKIVYEPAPPLGQIAPYLSPTMVAAIDRGMAKDRNARFPDVANFVHAVAGDSLAPAVISGSGPPGANIGFGATQPSNPPAYSNPSVPRAAQVPFPTPGISAPPAPSSYPAAQPTPSAPPAMGVPGSFPMPQQMPVAVPMSMPVPGQMPVAVPMSLPVPAPMSMPVPPMPMSMPMPAPTPAYAAPPTPPPSTFPVAGQAMAQTAPPGGKGMRAGLIVGVACVALVGVGVGIMIAHSKSGGRPRDDRPVEHRDDPGGPVAQVQPVGTDLRDPTVRHVGHESRPEQSAPPSPTPSPSAGAVAVAAAGGDNASAHPAPVGSAPGDPLATTTAPKAPSGTHAERPPTSSTPPAPTASSAGPSVATDHVLGGPPSFTEGQITGVVEGHLNEIQSCYQKVLEHDPAVKGQLTLMITVEEAGNVTTAMCAYDGIRNQPLRTCVESAASDWTFPKPSDGLGSFQYTIDFNP